MAAGVMTRQQIIDLINQYIYTNGRQRITAAQLNQIFLEIANAFAMEGSAGGGLDSVLAIDPEVSEGREITNANGGKVILDSETSFGEFEYRFLGIQRIDEENQGAVYSGSISSVIGNIKKDHPVGPQSFFEMYNQQILPDGEIYAGTSYIATGTVIEDESVDGIYSAAISDRGRNEHAVTPDKILSSIETDERLVEFRMTANKGFSLYTEEPESDNYNGALYVGQNEITGYLNNGLQSSDHVQHVDYIELKVYNAVNQFIVYTDNESQTWSNQDADIFAVESNGIRLTEDKKLTLTEGTTAGTATLVAGTVTVSTTAILANSVVSLTVQATGNYAGNIRVKNIVAGTRFDIFSTANTDTCTVFWQIIDL